MNTLSWADLSEAQRDEALSRPLQERQQTVQEGAARIIAEVRAGGDDALRQLTQKFDGVTLESLQVTDAEIDAASAVLAPQLRADIDAAYARIRLFHEAGIPTPISVETAPGVVCERMARAIQTVGLYVPAGSAPLPSTALMLGVPAQIAGCNEIILCSPPQADGQVEPSVLYAANRCGIRRIFKLGGAQAIAAMAFGTQTLPRCDKLFGPGNAWVTAAKVAVAADPQGPAIDLPAGPSEVLVIADDSANARFVAADLLSQAEHGADSQVILVTTSAALARAVPLELQAQLGDLPRAETARLALANSRLFLVRDAATAIAVSNRYAPEHLILSMRDARQLLPMVQRAGSIFLGNYSPESVGDYCSGTNHVLPTDGAARAWSGVSVQSFMTLITVQELSPQGLAGIGPCAVRLARAEGLEAHARAVSLRLETLS